MLAGPQRKRRGRRSRRLADLFLDEVLVSSADDFVEVVPAQGFASADREFNEWLARREIRREDLAADDVIAKTMTIDAEDVLHPFLSALEPRGVMPCS